MGIKQNVKEWFEYLVINIVEKYHYVDKITLEDQLSQTSEDLSSDFVGAYDFENLEYEVEDQGGNISNHEDRIDKLEEDFIELEKKLKDYDKIFKKLKRVDSWTVTVHPDGESVVETVTAVEPEEENIDEE